MQVEECTKTPETAILNNAATTFAEFIRSELNEESILMFSSNLLDANIAHPETVPEIIEWILQRGIGDDLLNPMEHFADCLANAAAVLADICDDYRGLVERQKNEVEDIVITLNMGDNEAEAATLSQSELFERFLVAKLRGNGSQSTLIEAPVLPVATAEDYFLGYHGGESVCFEHDFAQRLLDDLRVFENPEIELETLVGDLKCFLDGAKFLQREFAALCIQTRTEQPGEDAPDEVHDDWEENKSYVLPEHAANVKAANQLKLPWKPGSAQIIAGLLNGSDVMKSRFSKEDIIEFSNALMGGIEDHCLERDAGAV